MMTAAESKPENEFVSFRVRDWEGTRQVHLDTVSVSATVGEIVLECVRALGLPPGRFYHAHSGGRELAHSDTLGEAGILADAELEITPDVSAG